MTQTEKTDTPTTKILPSIELAYPLAIASYETAQKRLEAVEKRLQEVMAFAIALTLAVITVLAGKNYNFRTHGFYTAVICFLLGIGICFYARLSGHLIVISPKKLFDNFVEMPTREFQRQGIYFAGKNWEINNQTLLRKSRLTNLAVFFFTVEFILLGIWAMAAFRP